MRHHSNRTGPIMAQIQEKEYNAFLADGSNNGPQSLTDRIFPQISGINLASEEVLKGS